MKVQVELVVNRNDFLFNMLLSWSSTVLDLVKNKKLLIILASGSPRRKEILASLLLSDQAFVTRTSNFEETLPKSNFKTAGDYALATARGKAYDVANKISSSDTQGLFSYAFTLFSYCLTKLKHHRIDDTRNWCRYGRCVERSHP